MKTKYIQTEDLEKARKLQQDCLDMNIPAPPVILYEVEKLDENDNVIEKTIAKANSYVQNAYNLLAMTLGFGVTTDGFPLYYQYTTGLTNNTIYCVTAKTYSNLDRFHYFRCTIGIGNGTTPDKVSDYKLDQPYSSNDDYRMDGEPVRVKNKIGNKITNRISGTITNRKTTPLEITEMGLFINDSGTANTAGNEAMMMIRDIIDPIIIEPNERIRLTYQTEVLFPS